MFRSQHCLTGLFILTSVPQRLNMHACGNVNAFRHVHCREVQTDSLTQRDSWDGVWPTQSDRVYASTAQWVFVANVKCASDDLNNGHFC